MDKETMRTVEGASFSESFMSKRERGHVMVLRALGKDDEADAISQETAEECAELIRQVEEARKTQTPAWERTT